MHFADPPDQARCAELVTDAAGADVAGTHRLRHGRGQGLGQGQPRRPRPGAGRPLRRAWPARPRPRAAQQARHRDRGGAGLRHRPSRHHAGLPAAARPRAEGATGRGACSISAPAPACWRSPPPRRCTKASWRATSTAPSVDGRARERPAERDRASGAGDPRHRLLRRRHFAGTAPFDLVLANILANPLRQLATPMARHLRR